MALYVEIVDADKYFLTRPFSDKWIEATNENKVSCLTLAQKHIDSLPLIGRKLEFSQENQFPRYYVSNSRYISAGYDEEIIYNSKEIPQEVKDAVCEEALAILKYMNEERYSLKEQGVASASRGGLSESYETYKPLELLLSFEAKRLMQNWIASNPNI